MVVTGIAFALLLLLAYSSTSRGSFCTFGKDDTHCVCSTEVFTAQRDLLLCAQALEFELRDGRLDNTMNYFGLGLLQNLPIKKLTANNITVSSSFLTTLLYLLPSSRVVNISITSSTLEGIEPSQSPFFLSFLTKAGLSKIEALHLEEVTVNSSLLTPSLHNFHLWLLGPLKMFSLVRSDVVEPNCRLASLLGNVTHLDLSKNHISDSTLQGLLNCDPFPSVKSLAFLGLRDNSLTSLQPLCELQHHTPALTEVDISGNNFSYFPLSHCFTVTDTLRRLNLSRSGITEIGSPFSVALEELDLSANALEVFSNPPKGLKRLYLSKNRLVILPSLANLTMLEVLEVDSNQLTTLYNGSELGHWSVLENLQVLRAGINPYHCDCSLSGTMLFLKNAHTVSVEDWPEGFVCVTPETQKGTNLLDLPIPDKCSNGKESPVSTCFLFGYLYWFLWSFYFVVV